MESHSRISELLVQTGAYTDLDKPVVLTSGQLGIYYINTEKLLEDNGKFKKYRDNSWAMINHTVQVTRGNPNFREIVNILTERARSYLELPSVRSVISGGQRRDWIFSGPVAHQLEIPHVSLYKDGKIETITPQGNKYSTSLTARDMESLHIANLLTEGSSCYRTEGGVENGWVPMLRRNRIKVDNLMVFVTRLQGEKEILKKQFVNTHPFVAIDENFLRQHSKQPETVIDYTRDINVWSENYLRENGAIALIGTFNPRGGKLDRAKKFLERYQNVLEETGHFEELEPEVQLEFGQSLEEVTA